VHVDSEPGRGSCFRVFLPRVVGQTTDAAGVPPAVVPLSAEHPATIVIVEDEELVRAVTARVLDRAGYSVIEAPDGEEALRLVRRHQPTIDLLITDVVMAKLGGLELARRIVNERPGFPILLMSGYNREEMAAEDPSIGFLQKPFTPNELLEAVSRLLRACARPQGAGSPIADRS